MRFGPKFSRRNLLRGTAAGAALLPFVPLLESHAELGDAPKRLVLFYTPNGTRLQHWRPSGSTSDFQLSQILSPLAGYEDKLLILDGVDNQCIYTGPGSGHQATGCLWTGTELMEGDLFVEGSNMPSGWAGGPSVDQVVAQALSGTTPFDSLELGTFYTNHSAQLRTRMSYRAAGEPVPPDGDPYNVFDRLFAQSGLDPQQIAQIRAARLSTIDMVKDDLAGLKTKLGSADKVKLEAHLENLRSIEERFANGIGVDCDEPVLQPGQEGFSAAKYRVHADMQLDLLTEALSCDLTRVASMFWMQETGGPKFDNLGHGDGFHAISHLTDNAGTQQMIEICQWYATKFKELLDRLDAVPEGDGTMLDNTVVVWASPLSNSYNHSNRNIPIVMAGSCGGYFNTGRYLKWGSHPDGGGNADHGGQTNNNWLLSLCHAMGVEIETIGNPDYCDGPLSELT